MNERLNKVKAKEQKYFETSFKLIYTASLFTYLAYLYTKLRYSSVYRVEKALDLADFRVGDNFSVKQDG